MRALENEALLSVLKQYGITPQHIEPISKKVYKVYTNKGTYALKNIEPRNSKTLISTLQLLVQSRYKSFIPIYHTKNNDWLAKTAHSYYYLMPWKKNKKRDEVDDFYIPFFHELANLHHHTKKEWMLNERVYEKHFMTISNRFESEKQQLERFLEKCEKNWYMSPFELQAVMYINETLQALHFAKIQLEEWYEKMKESPVARIVLTHGNLSYSHFLLDEEEKRYFINFERSHYASPVQDLIHFYQQILTSQPFQCNQCLEWLMAYENRFPLLEAEKKLLISYLAYPSPMIKVIQQYENKSNDYSELNDCQRILKRYWLMKNIEYVVMRWTDKENEEKAKNAPPSS